MKTQHSNLSLKTIVTELIWSVWSSFQVKVNVALDLESKVSDYGEIMEMK